VFSSGTLCGYFFLIFLQTKYLDMCHVTRYHFVVIKTFRNKDTMELYCNGKSKRLQPDILKMAIRRLEYIDHATCLEDLKVPPSNRLHVLKGDREGQYAIAVNDQWRICFLFSDGDAYDVEITDYH
jgi:proteic killer suppression protein